MPLETVIIANVHHRSEHRIPRRRVNAVRKRALVYRSAGTAAAAATVGCLYVMRGGGLGATRRLADRRLGN